VKLENIVQLGIGSFGLTKSLMQEFGPEMKSLENLKIHFDFRNQNRNLEWLPNLKALKTLELWTTKFSIVLRQIENLKKMQPGFKKLSIFRCHLDWDAIKYVMEFPTDQTLILQDSQLWCNTSVLLDILNVLRDKKNVKIHSITLRLKNDLDEEKTKETFKQAEEIIKQSFLEQGVLIWQQ
jgi:hypothetical protein